MFERFTDRSRKVMAIANQAALELSSTSIEPIHILLGLVREGCGVGAKVLTLMRVDLKSLETCVLMDRSSRSVRGLRKMLPQTVPAKRVLVVAMEESAALKHNHVGTEHLLLALIQSDDTDVVEILSLYDVELEPARKTVLKLLSST